MCGSIGPRTTGSAARARSLTRPRTPVRSEATSGWGADGQPVPLQGQQVGQGQRPGPPAAGRSGVPHPRQGAPSFRRRRRRWWWRTGPSPRPAGERHGAHAQRRDPDARVEDRRAAVVLDDHRTGPAAVLSRAGLERGPRLAAAHEVRRVRLPPAALRHPGRSVRVVLEEQLVPAPSKLSCQVTPSGSLIEPAGAVKWNPGRWGSPLTGGRRRGPRGTRRSRA